MPSHLPRRRAAALGLLVLAALLPAAPAPAAEPPAPSGRVLLQLDTPFTAPGLLTAAARNNQAERLRTVRARLISRISESGARTTRTYDGLPFVAVDGDAKALRRLSGAPEVAAVLPDEQHRVSLASSAPHIGASTVWGTGNTGSGQTVAMLDTGVETSHAFLAGKVVAEACFAASSTCPDGSTKQIGPGSAAPCTYDDKACPHGTHVAGIVAGVGPSEAGIARGASLIAVQIFSRATSNCPGGTATCATGWTSDLMAGLDHVATLAQTRPIAAVNLSLGGGSYSGVCDSSQPALKRAVDALRSLGVATVASTGNEGNASAISSPGCLSSAIAVGSASLGDAVNAFSNSSPQLALLAPGERIHSSYTAGRYAWMTGTSQSAPHVAGAVALLKSAHPTASVKDVLGALTRTGLPVTDGRNGRTTPRIRVDAALADLTLAMTVVEPEPTPTQEPTQEPTPAPTTAAPAPVLQPAPAPAVVQPAPTPTPTPTPSPTSSPTPAPAPTRAPADEPAEPTSTRLSGSDRYDTAAQIFSAGFSCEQGGADRAVLARGDAFADALAGSYLAGAKDTGVLLTGTTSIPAPTLAALRGSGARTVYLLGGTSAISDAVAAQLAKTPSYDCAGTRGAALQVVRISGANRFDTARRTAEHAGSAAVGTADLTGRPLRTAVVASGLGFADALAAGPLSYAGAGEGGFPTLLTSPTALAPEAEAALKALRIEQVVVPGGTAVVSPAVESRLKALGLHVQRLAGSNRSETAAEVARFAVRELGFTTAGVSLARGDAFADALAGAAYAGDKRLVLLLTAGPGTLGDATRSYLSSAAGRTTSVTAFGGLGAIGGATLAEAVASLVE